MKITLAVLILSLVISTLAILVVCIRYRKLSVKYRKTLNWGKAMRDEAIKQGDLYINARNQLDILNGRKRK